MKTELKIFTTILSVLACFFSLPETKAASLLLPRRTAVTPDSQRPKAALPFKTLPRALETQELVGVRSFQW